MGVRRGALDAHLVQLEEAERATTATWATSSTSSPFRARSARGSRSFIPKGGPIRRVMEEYSRQRHEASGYEFVILPHITKAELFETSGHLVWFAEIDVPTDGARRGSALLPQAHELSLSRADLQVPSSAATASCRCDCLSSARCIATRLSGVVQGLTRVRGMTQDDAHIFCTREQMAEELDETLNFVLDLLRDFGLNDFYLELSTRPPKKPWATTRSGTRPRRRWPRWRAAAGTRSRAGRGRWRVLRSQDLGTGERRHRAHPPDVDRPAGLPTAQKLRRHLRRRGQHANRARS